MPSNITAGLALAVAIAALVVAIHDGTSRPAAVAGDTAVAAQAPAAAVDVPKDAERVTIVDFEYSPEPVRVRAGTPIAWTNEDAVPHTVTAQDGSWGSNVMDEDDTFVATFDEPGVYVYICELHPPRHGAIAGAPEGAKLVGGGGKGMQGTVIVE